MTRNKEYPYVAFYQYFVGFMGNDCRFDLVRAETIEVLEYKLQEAQIKHHKHNFQLLWTWEVKDIEL